MDNDGNIERLLTGWKYCNLYYFFTIEVLNVYTFYPIFTLKVITMLGPFLQSYGSSIFFIF